MEKKLLVIKVKLFYQQIRGYIVIQYEVLLVDLDVFRENVLDLRLDMCEFSKELVD